MLDHFDRGRDVDAGVGQRQRRGVEIGGVELDVGGQPVVAHRVDADAGLEAPAQRLPEIAGAAPDVGEHARRRRARRGASATVW